MTNINFPDNPSDGDRVGLQVYDATRGVWEWDALPGDTSAESLLENTEIISKKLEYLVIAGGGGGGQGVYGYNAGGGAGGYYTNRSGENQGGGVQSLNSGLMVYSGNVFSITVGAGGAVNSNGSNSEFGNGLRTLGGGRGAQADGNSGGSGGSGGGGAYNRGNGTGTYAQGFNGGTGNSPSGGVAYGGGGGGAGGAGANAGGSPGVGGPGLYSSIAGSSTPRAGGGAGGGNSGTTGGIGGGGDSQQPGVANTGGGGGGEIRYSNAGAGGSGIVILRFYGPVGLQVSAGLAYTQSSVGNDSVYTFTAGTGTVTIS